ncbi:MAG: phosphatidylserine decarboxylase [Planctomycetes bacterium]|nr:phosphatidylserine decarboxylase [Planctomycetota bacterium]
MGAGGDDLHGALPPDAHPGGVSVKLAEERQRFESAPAPATPTPASGARADSGAGPGAGLCGDRFTRHGTSTLLGASTILIVASAAALTLAVRAEFVAAWYAAGACVICWLVVLSFFRNPRRTIPAGDALVLSAADGVVTDVTPVERETFIDGPAVRIGVFLSVFNVHVNRAPVAGIVRHLCHRPGAFASATSKRARESNECQEIGIETPAGTRVLVRQIAGLIARRIVCPLREGDAIAKGFDFGMIRFGSRTEVSVPARDGARFRCAVSPGDKVKGGSTVLGEWEGRAPPEPGARGKGTGDACGR